MRKLYLFLTLLFCQLIQAQVGINTTAPNAQLDIRSGNQALPTNTDGILIPKIDFFPGFQPSVAQQGMLVYLTTLVSGNQPGFYYWDNLTSSWIAIGSSLNSWGLKGNANTNATANFIGTTDNVDLIFKRNNVKAGSIEFTNTSFGNFAANLNSIGTRNTAVGALASFSNTGGSNNVAVGYNTLSLNIGSENTGVGSSALQQSAGGFNSAFGFNALNANTSGANNVAVGHNAMQLGTVSNFNSALGVNALNTNNNGNNNVAVGANSLLSNNASENTAAGFNSLRNNSTGVGNSAVGYEAMRSNNANYNAAFGHSASFSNNAGTRNTAVGALALYTNNGGSNNVAIGYNSMSMNTASESTAVGANALQNNSGAFNSALGYNSLNLNAGGSNNTAVGHGALQMNNGNTNSALGFNALNANSTGINNSAFGSNALTSNSAGTDNSSFGNNSLQVNASSFNTAFGANSLIQNTNGQGNTAVGFFSMQANTNGSLNTTLGFLSTLGSNSLTNATAIGANAMASTSNSLVLGSINGVNTATSSTNVGIGTPSPLDRLHVVGNIRMVDGNQAAGKVLTSDANGTASWTTVSSSSGTLDQAYDSGGAGNGKTITADAGAVNISGPDGLVSIRTGSGGVVAPTGTGVRMVWNPRKSAFRAGQVFATEWDDANIGSGSIAFGAGTISSANQSSAFGFSTVASGNVSAAFGSSTTASGSISTVFGDGNTAPSYGETVLGIGATTYTLSTNGATQFRTANFYDRLFVVGNAVDSNNNNVIDTAERSNALVILKNGLTGLGVSIPSARLDVRDGNVITTDTQFGNLNIMTNAAQGVDVGGAITLGGNTSATSASPFGSIEGRKTDAVSGNKNGYLSFKTNSGPVIGLVERMRINDVGFVGIGTPSPSRALHLFTGTSGGTPNASADFVLEANGPLYQHFLTPSTSEAGLLFGSEVGSIRGGVLFNNANETLQFRTGGNVNRMLITNAGDVGIGTTPGGQFELSLNEGRKPGSTVWTMTSDARLKTVEGDFIMGLDEIKQLHPVRYHYKDAGARKFEPKVLAAEFSGFLAQEVQKVFPNCVTTDADGYLSLNIHDILVASVNALKELDAKNIQLQSENAVLKAKIKQHDEQIMGILAELEKKK